jgi:hypothetical protein
MRDVVHVPPVFHDHIPEHLWVHSLFLLPALSALVTGPVPLTLNLVARMTQ